MCPSPAVPDFRLGSFCLYSYASFEVWDLASTSTPIEQSRLMGLHKLTYR
jgi:hypothetical protein